MPILVGGKPLSETVLIEFGHGDIRCELVFELIAGMALSQCDPVPRGSFPAEPRPEAEPYIALQFPDLQAIDNVIGWLRLLREERAKRLPLETIDEKNGN